MLHLPGFQGPRPSASRPRTPHPPGDAPGKRRAQKPGPTLRNLHRELAQGGLSHTGGGMQGHPPPLCLPRGLVPLLLGSQAHQSPQSSPCGLGALWAQPGAQGSGIPFCPQSTPFHPAQPHTRFPHIPSPLKAAGREPKRRLRKWTEAPRLPTAPHGSPRLPSAPHGSCVSPGNGAGRLLPQLLTLQLEHSVLKRVTHCSSEN